VAIQLLEKEGKPDKIAQTLKIHKMSLYKWKRHKALLKSIVEEATRNPFHSYGGGRQI
jgi:hypothetical protein